MINPPSSVTMMPHNKGFSEDDECAICFETDIEESLPEIAGSTGYQHCLHPIRQNNPQRVVYLSCHPAYLYHEKCLRDWLGKSATCPFDRRGVSVLEGTFSGPLDKLKSLYAKIFRCGRSSID